MTARLSLPKCGGGHLQFNRMVQDYGGFELVARDFHVAPELVQRWMAGISQVPRTAMLALWWHTNHGFDQAFRESHWTHAFMCFLRTQARDRVELLERLIVQAGYLVPPGQLMTDSQVMALPADDSWRAHVTTVQAPVLSLQSARTALPSPAAKTGSLLDTWELSA